MNKFSNKELSIIGAILWSCEGTRLRRDKRRKNEVYHWAIEFTNSNPKLIQLFLKFIREIIGIDEKRLKGQLFIYDDLKKHNLERFWLSISRIPFQNLNKTMILRAKNMRFKPNPKGTFKIRYHSKEAFKKLDSIVKKYI